MTDSPEIDSRDPRGNPGRVAVAYVAMLLIVAIALALTLVLGPESSPADAPISAANAAHPEASPPAPSPARAFQQLLLAMAAVLLTGRLLGRCFAVVRQPPVIGEVVAGLLLGPSLLGRIWPEAAEFVLPPSVAPLLGGVSQLGVTLYMFVIGMEFDLGQLRRQGGAVLVVAHAGIAAPFALGLLLALGLYPRMANPGVPFLPLALFLGVSLSVTAFPVLARILSDGKISQTQVGVMALACAAAGDATAWCLLALVVGVTQVAVGAALWTIAGAVLYVLAMIFAARPLVERIATRAATPESLRGLSAALFAALLLSALLTEALGLHAIFGAFMMGAIIPHASPMARRLSQQLDDVVTILLLPAFFAYTGLRTQIGLVQGAPAWALCGLIIALATLGKMGGTIAAARWLGFDRRIAATLGVLMNTRGLMELIVLNVGLDLGVISAELFAMLVLMAVATTIATAPLLQVIYPRSENSLSSA